MMWPGLRRGGYARRVSLRPPQGVLRREWREGRGSPAAPAAPAAAAAPASAPARGRTRPCALPAGVKARGLGSASVTESRPANGGEPGEGGVPCREWESAAAPQWHAPRHALRHGVGHRPPERRLDLPPGRRRELPGVHRGRRRALGPRRCRRRLAAVRPLVRGRRPGAVRRHADAGNSRRRERRTTDEGRRGTTQAARCCNGGVGAGVGQRSVSRSLARHRRRGVAGGGLRRDRSPGPEGKGGRWGAGESRAANGTGGRGPGPLRPRESPPAMERVAGGGLRAGGGAGRRGGAGNGGPGEGEARRGRGGGLWRRRRR